MAEPQPEQGKATEDGTNEKTSITSGDGNAKEGESDCRQCMQIDKRLLPSKLFYFFFFGGLGAVFPYLTIYFKQLGLDPLRIGLLSGIRPFLGFVSGPLWGAIADRYRARKVMLILSLCGWIATLMALGFVPAAAEGKCPVTAADMQHYFNKSGRDFRNRDAARDHRSMSDVVTHMTCGSCAFPDMAQMESLRSAGGQDRTPDMHAESKLNRRGAMAQDQEIQSYIAVMNNQEDNSWLYDEESLQNLFIILMALIVIGELLQSPTTALADTATLDNLENNLHKYGHQRVWGAVGLGACSFTVGALINMTRQTTTKCGVEIVFSDYHIAFYIFGGMLLVAVVVATQLKFAAHDKDQPSQHNLGSLLKILCTVHYMSILVVSFFMGVCNGLVYGFLFWHLENLGASQLLLGTASVVIYGSEVIMFFLTHRLISIIGHMAILYLGLVCYAARFMIYSQLVDPWWVIPAEVLQGITFAAVWTVLASYLSLAVPNASFATMQGILHGIYWGLGSGVGNMLGGVFVDFFGAVRTFAGYSIASCVVLVLFIIVQRIFPRPKSTQGGYDELDGDVKMTSVVKGEDQKRDADAQKTTLLPVEVAAAKGIPGPDFD